MDILNKTVWAAPLLLAIGCATSAHKVASTASSSGKVFSEDENSVTQVDYREPASTELVQPRGAVRKERNIDAPPLGEELLPPLRLPDTVGLTLAAIEQMAFANNPAIAQSEARIRALRGKWVQAGLPPNPTAGYTGGEIGNDGGAGQNGLYVGQNFITAHKLQRDRAVVAAEIDKAEQDLVSSRRRVQTDAQRAYYEALLAQKRVELAEELGRIADEAVSSSQSLVDAEEIPLAGLLQTEVQQQNTRVLLRTSENGRYRAWRNLTAVIGGADLPIQPLVGDVGQLPVSLEWTEQLSRLKQQSPEIAAAFANVDRARRALDRASVEAVPNVSTQFSVQYDDGTGDTIAGVQVGMPIPLWNRNQGGIRQAQAEVTEALRNAARVELDLNQRLADVFQQYADAQVTAETYSSDILPRSQRTLDLVQKGYQQGEVGYLDLLTAQQTFSQANLAYLDAVGDLWQSYVRIEGLLLEGSLSKGTD
ncbi:Cobalt-zinc-cadmium resistance protein CzcC precursor [Pseudobythopirellula maris]|uniref:Cobalt-zinc-cadmium resistance protein CzcC n=1 Tax=Pseudobythopirellula maris TaxID=2527991 RepID=A0A5C5ZIS4_9BACT|nr:TolC family protein [Pseudobythopirellula maris]TWT86711.1 Cobalt-zinc-cadmium resistance protein CzcC precursor [Pseudobythopirellula maris]